MKKSDAMNYCDPSASPKASVDDHPADRCLEAWCERCKRAVDAVCPCCKSHVEGEKADLSRSPASSSVLSRAEFYRRFVTLISSARNAKFELGCYLIATGDAYADGVSMTDFAKKWGVGKATVSKRCKIICAYLGIEPSRYMRDEQTAAKFRESNRRPRKVE